MFDSFKKRNARIRKKIYRDKNGTREELDQQIRSYASNPELRERKKIVTSTSPQYGLQSCGFPGSEGTPSGDQDK